MSKELNEPWSIARVVNHVGSENIKVQNLATCLASGHQGKTDCRLTFFTSKEHGASIMREACMGKDKGVIGLVLWIPVDKLPPELKPA